MLRAIDNHQINPVSKDTNTIISYTNTIKLSLVCRHYDVIVKSVRPKAEQPDTCSVSAYNVRSELNASLSLNLDDDKEKQPESQPEPVSSNSSLSVSYQGCRRYIFNTVESETPICLPKVPDDIDGNKLYEVPIHDTTCLFFCEKFHPPTVPLKPREIVTTQKLAKK